MEEEGFVLCRQTNEKPSIESLFPTLAMYDTEYVDGGQYRPRPGLVGLCACVSFESTLTTTLAHTEAKLGRTAHPPS